MHHYKATRTISFLLIAALVFSCNTQKPYIAKSLRNMQMGAPPADSTLIHTSLLIGDAGEPSDTEMQPSLKMLEMLLQGNDTLKALPQLTPEKSSVIFLGDNIYYRGLPDESAEDRAEMERKLNAQLDVVKDFAGRKIFIPGNHDWNESSRGGWEAVVRQQKYVEAYLNNLSTYFPKNGCPGPVEVLLNDNLLLLIVDSEWWLHPHEKPYGADEGCIVNSDYELILSIEDALIRHQDKHVLFAQHHPLYSNGIHGGHFSLKDHIFPLTLVRDNLYVPLPIIGSIYPLGRMYGVSRQDLSNPRYQALKLELLNVLERYDNIIFAAGHEHNLQYSNYNDLPHIVSGAGSKMTFARRGKGAEYVHQAEGLARLDYYKNGEVWLSFLIPDATTAEPIITIRRPVHALSPKTFDMAMAADSLPDYTDSVAVLAAGPEYAAGKMKRWLFGNLNRDVWTTPVKVPYLDMKTEQGGLKPVRRGGGQQTMSLRVLNPDSIQFNLRSVNKNPKGALPEPMHETLIEDVVQDQIATAHPYGALALPKMGSALGIHHTAPRLFYIPSSPLLGPYMNTHANMLVMMEIRPDEDLSAYQRFGFSKNVVSTNTLYKRLRKDNDNELNQGMLLKVRLFDMLLGDWDRHAKQWRWAEFDKEDKGMVLQPVPRDRDMVFVQYGGMVHSIFSKIGGFSKFISFDENLPDLRKLNQSAANLDRTLLNELSWQDWEQVALEMQLQLTDSIIELSVREMPEEAYAISGDEIVAKLKSRRDQLPEAILSYYQLLSKEVRIHSSDKHEHVQIERMQDSTNITIYKTKKDHDLRQQLYSRTFYDSLTNEIQLYTREGNDSIVVAGINGGIPIRIIPGEGKDQLIDQTSGANLLIYTDTNDDENLIEAGTKARLIEDSHDWHDEDDMEFYQQPSFSPSIHAAYNPDDQLYIGLGFSKGRPGFRKIPEQSRHQFMARYSTNLQALDFSYKANYYSIFSPLSGIQIQTHLLGPGFLFNYFGLGNESANMNDELDFHRISLWQFNLNPSFHYRQSNALSMGIGPTYNYTSIGENQDNILAGTPDSLWQAGSNHFVGAFAYLNLDVRDSPLHPTRGVYWQNHLGYAHEIGGNNYQFANLYSALNFYLTPNWPFNATFAFRFGAMTNLGDYYFYQANFLGGTDYLRGFYRNRFGGNSAIFQNTELRLQLSSIQNYIFSGTWGISGFIDHGMVQNRQQQNVQWQRGYGPGIWFHLFNTFTISGDMGFSEEGNYLNIRLGQFF